MQSCSESKYKQHTALLWRWWCVCACVCTWALPQPLTSCPGEVSMALRKISPWCTSSLVCLLNKHFWIDSDPYLFSVPRWPAHPSLPGMFPEQALASPPSWAPPLSRVVDPSCSHGQTQLFCVFWCFVSSSVTGGKKKKKSKNVFFFTFQFWGKLL